MKRETLAELVVRTVIEFEKREAKLQTASLIQQAQFQKGKTRRKSKVA